MSRISRRFLSGLLPVLALTRFSPTPLRPKNPPGRPISPPPRPRPRRKRKSFSSHSSAPTGAPGARSQAAVFDQQAFTSAARKQFVLVQVDFPHERKLPDELKEQNGKLAKKYKINAYPSVLLLKPDGELMAQTGYSPGGPKDYLKQLAGLMKTYQSLAGSSQLPAATGLDRAKLLDQLIDAYNGLDNKIGDIAGWRKEIVALDSHNKAGLKRKYEFQIYLNNAQRAVRLAKPAAAETAIDKALGAAGSQAAATQRATIVKSKCCLARKDYQASLACLRKALDAARQRAGCRRPESPHPAIRKAPRIAKGDQGRRQSPLAGATNGTLISGG